MNNANVINKIENFIKTQDQSILDNLIEDLKTDMIKDKFVGNKKKAISMLKQFTHTRLIRDSRPVLQYSKKFKDKYYCTDSYILVASDDELIPSVKPEDKQYYDYPEITKLLDRLNGGTEIFNLNDLDKPKIEADYKLDKKSFTRVYHDNKLIGAYANSYLIFMLNYFDKEDVTITRKGNEIKPIIVTGKKTKDIILISPIREYK